MEASGKIHAHAALPPRKEPPSRPGTHWRGGWLGFGAGLDAVKKRKIRRPAGNRIMKHRYSSP
jgi:hypothetical protein